MSEPILCHECGHDIAQHEPGEYCNGCFWESDIGAVDCALTPYDIAHAYADERVREAMDGHRCDEQAERAYQRAITAEAAARRLRSMRDEVAAEATLARQAHRSCRVDHFAHDYCRWVGMSEAYHNVLNILDRSGDE